MPATLRAPGARGLEETAVFASEQRVGRGAGERAHVVGHVRLVVVAVFGGGARPVDTAPRAEQRLHAPDAREPLGPVAGGVLEPAAQVPRAVAAVAREARDVARGQ